MSHWVNVTVEINDLDALREAVGVLASRTSGIRLEENVLCRSYNEKQFELVLKLPGKYDVGLKRKLGFDNAWEIEYDDWQNHVSRVLGDGCVDLLTEYGVAKVMKQARAKGLTARRVKGKDGRPEVRVKQRN